MESVYGFTLELAHGLSISVQQLLLTPHLLPLGVIDTVSQHQ